VAESTGESRRRLRQLELTPVADWPSEADRKAFQLFAQGYRMGAQAERQTSVNLLRQGIAAFDDLPDDTRDAMLGVLKATLAAVGIDYDWEDAITGNQTASPLTGDDFGADELEAWLAAGAPLEISCENESEG
jgi:hypothetical protein